MTFLTLETIKAHLRIDSDINEDAMLTIYGNAAEEVLVSYLNRGKTVAAMTASLTEEYGGIPTPIVQAGLMLVDLSYQHRSPVSPQSLYVVPYTFDILVKPYMRLYDEESE